MKHFLHDTNSFSDENIKSVFTNFGYTGIGVYYTIVEKIAQHDRPVRTEVIQHQLQATKKIRKCIDFIIKTGLVTKFDGRLWAPILDKDTQKERLAYRNPAAWQQLTSLVFERDGFACTYCGSKDFIECDHIMPFSKGGSETLENLTTACRTCNRQKKDRNVNEFLTWKKTQN